MYTMSSIFSRSFLQENWAKVNNRMPKFLKIVTNMNVFSSKVCACLKISVEKRAQYRREHLYRDSVDIGFNIA